MVGHDVAFLDDGLVVVHDDANAEEVLGPLVEGEPCDRKKKVEEGSKRKVYVKKIGDLGNVKAKPATGEAWRFVTK